MKTKTMKKRISRRTKMIVLIVLGTVACLLLTSTALWYAFGYPTTMPSRALMGVLALFPFLCTLIGMYIISLLLDGHE